MVGRGIGHHHRAVLDGQPTTMRPLRAARGRADLRDVTSGCQTRRMLWRFVRAPATCRGWAWHIVGGALLMPYLMAVEVIVVAVGDGDGFGSTLLLAQL